MITVLEGFPDNVAAFACHGHITRSDYATVLEPAIEKALKKHASIRIYYETAADFEGIDPGAILEDTKVGLVHLLRWERFAVVTDVEWIRHAVSFFSFLMPGKMRVFPASETAEARLWVSAD
jgi:hypothetical protein